MNQFSKNVKLTEKWQVVAIKKHKTSRNIKKVKKIVMTLKGSMKFEKDRWKK